MNPTYAPRKSTGGVDVQLEEFETDLRNTLVFQLIMNINRGYWREMSRLSDDDNKSIENLIDHCFVDMFHRYKSVPSVMDVLERCRILIQDIIWVAMNVPYQNILTLHVETVVDNAINVYVNRIYPILRTEMIMANHHIEVLQRSWRRCASDPSHPACRRRLIREFNSLGDA